MKRVVILLFFVQTSLCGISKEVEIDTFLVNKEKEINAQLLKVRATRDDQMRMLENESLEHLIESILAYPGSFDYPFESFQTLSTLRSPDNVFRLFNWNIEDNNGLNSHYCYMILPSRADKPNEVIKFKEDNVTIPPRPENLLLPTTWYGALYYKIIPVEKGNKTLYTMIGYNGGSRNTNKKILDVFYFKGKTLRLGYPLFQESAGSKQLLKRVFFEYSEKATIAVNFNDQLDAIVFDHLVPETPNLTGMYDFYVPDMTYDGYTWGGSIWEYKEDLVAVNKTNRKVRLYGPNQEGAENDTFVDVKDQWVDPVDGNPYGGGSNAIAPVETQDGKKTKKVKQRDRQHRKGWFRRRKEPRSAIRD